MAPCLLARSGQVSRPHRSYRFAIPVYAKPRSLLASGARHAVVNPQVILGHAAGTEALFEGFATARTDHSRHLTHGLNRLFDAGHNKSRDPFLHDFRHGAVWPGDDRRAASQGLDHDQAERLRPIDREEERQRPGHQILLVLAANLADKFYEWIVEEGLDLVVEIILIGLVDLGRNFQFQASTCGDL